MMKAARLNSDLLLRKGTAQPVPEVINSRHGSVDRPALATVNPVPERSSRLTRQGVTTPTAGDSHQEMTRDRFGRVRVSLRLDPHRHLRLKLLSAHRQLSIQECLIDALDAYLDGEGETINNGSCNCLTEAGHARDDCNQACDARARDVECQGESS